MEAQLHRTHGRDNEDPRHSADLHREEERGGETTSAMKKVKEKVDKLKTTIKHGHHGRHGGSELKDEAETVNNSAVVRSGLVEPTVMGTPVLAEDLYATHSDILDPPVRSFAQWQDEERRGSPPPLSTAYETRHTDLPHGGHHTCGGDVNREQLKGSIGNPTGLKEEERHGAPPPPSTGYESLTDPLHVGRNGQDVNREPLKGSIGNPTGLEERYGAPPPSPSTGYESHPYDEEANRELLRGRIGNPTGLEEEGIYGAPPPPVTGIYGARPADVSQVGHDVYGDEDLNSYPVLTGISTSTVEEGTTDTGGKEVRITEVTIIDGN